ncbi:MAG: PUR family DNA/RNA-binding protein [Ignavibacteriae bacterium]|nr:PUR family DNA/RNA-binding protein [Ignavibacteriota bacterium]
MSGKEAIFSVTVKAGKTTYFVDVKESQAGNKYLSITQRNIEGEEKKYTTVRVVSTKVSEFRDAVDKAAKVVAEP